MAKSPQPAENDVEVGYRFSHVAHDSSEFAEFKKALESSGVDHYLEYAPSDQGEGSDTPEQGSSQAESLKTGIKPNKNESKVNTCVFIQALTVVVMKNTTPSPHISDKSGTKVLQARLKKTLLGILYFVLFVAIIPTWILSYFGYDIDIVTVVSIKFCASAVLVLGATAQGFARSETLKAAADGNIGLQLRNFAMLAALRAFLAMLLFGALGYDVGFLHIVLAYVVPMFVVRFVRLAPQKKIGKPTLTSSSLLHVSAGRQS